MAGRQREAAEEAAHRERDKWKKLVIERSELQWRLEAEQSHQRIMAKVDGVWYKP